MKIPPLVSFIKQLIYNGLESFGRYYSSYRAYVADNGDPQGLQRLKLIIPEISIDEPYLYWAFSKGVFSGKSVDGILYGSQVLPQKGDLVWVEFERGNPEVPIWSLGHMGLGDKQMDAQLMDPNCFWFITPQGNRVILNDTNNSINAKLNTGQELYINQQGVSIVHDKSLSLGSLGNSAEPALLGKSHNGQHGAMLDSILNMTFMTAMGPSSTCLNSNDFIEQKQTLPDALSSKVTLD